MFKTTKLFCKTLLFASVMLMVACEKADTSIDVTEEEAVALLTTAFSTNSAGMSGQVNNLATVSISSGSLCGLSKDSSFTYANTTGAITWNYAHNWHWDVACTNGTPSTWNANFKATGEMNSEKLSAKDTATGSVTAVKSGVLDSFIVVNGNYQRSGTYTTKIGSKSTFEGKAVLTATDLKVLRQPFFAIVSGSITAKVTGITKNGKTFSYEATITLGKTSAVIAVTGGKTYTITW